MRGTGTENTVALIATKKGNRRLAVDLGPKNGLKGASPKKGQTIAAEGIVVPLRDRQLFVATRVKQNGDVVKIDRMRQLQQAQKERNAKPGSPAKAQPGSRGH